MKLEGYRVVLASKSPRRKELLQKITEEFEILPAVGEEETKETAPDKVVEELAYQKAKEVFEKLIKASEQENKNLFIIGSDTIVSVDGKILGKPKTEEEAFEMLSSLSGRTHEVYTGVSLFRETASKTAEILTFSEKTEVHFYEMTEEEIRGYIATKDPMDKAGAYGIQGPCGKFIQGISGDYASVMGFPVARCYQEIKNWRQTL